MAQCKCLASEYDIREIIVFQKKRSLKLKLHEISDYRRDEKIYFEKKFKQLLSEKCEKIPIESFSLQNRNVYSNVSETVCHERFAGVLQVFLKCFILIQNFCQN